MTLDGSILLTIVQAFFYQRPFSRGDANADGAVNIADPVRVLNRLFLGQPLPCERAGDANDDGALDITDAVVELAYLFLGAKPLPPPFRSCSGDSTADALDCDSSPACE